LQERVVLVVVEMEQETRQQQHLEPQTLEEVVGAVAPIWLQQRVVLAEQAAQASSSLNTLLLFRLSSHSSPRQRGSARQVWLLLTTLLLAVVRAEEQALLEIMVGVVVLVGLEQEQDYL